MIGILLTILMLLPRSLCVVDCRTACKECEDHDQEHLEILEVYCAMCQECIEHRKEKKLRDNIERQEIIYNLEGHDECPPPPTCEPEPNNIPLDTTPQKLVSPTTTETTTIETTTTTPPTTQRPCPTAPPCKKRRPPSPCYPCMPMCPCPYPPYTSTGPQPLVESFATTTTKATGFLYLYIGVPKDILEALPVGRRTL